MKFIISHDVDHITVWEHKCDLIVPKFIARSFIEVILGYVSISEFGSRFKEIIKNKWQNLEEIAQFDRENEVDSTFYFGVNKGLGLCYSPEIAQSWTKRILEKGFDVGVHGIEFDNFDGIANEYSLFQELSGLKNFGMRMHCLRNTSNTVELLNQANYLFDSTVYELENPYKVGNLWEFPLHIMDTYLFNKNSRWQNQTFEKAKAETLRIIEQADKKGIEYFTILLHDRYFSDSFKSWKDWYVWVVDHLKSNGFEFINYRQAIQELERQAIYD